VLVVILKFYSIILQVVLKQTFSFIVDLILFKSMVEKFPKQFDFYYSIQNNHYNND
jgi:hypothetical protein